MRTLFVVCAFLTNSVLGLEGELDDAAWKSYFGNPPPQEQTFRISSPLWNYLSKERSKGFQSIEGKEWQAVVVTFNGGPSPDAAVTILSRWDERGRWEMQKGEKPLRMVPRPLKVGDTWKYGEEELTFVGFADFDRFDQVINGCALIEGKQAKETSKRYYQKGIGFIAKFVEMESGRFSKVAVKE